MKRVLCGSFALPLLISFGCSTTGGGTAPEDHGNPNAGGSGQTGSTGNKAGTTGFFVGDSGGTGSQTTSTGLVSPDSGCAAQKTDAELTQVNILVLLDKSGSMGDQKNSTTGEYDWQNCESRWNPVADTLKSFFTDANSGRLYASLSFLPADGDEYGMCTVKNYSSGTASIKVPLVLLDDAGRKKFTDKLCDCGAGITPATGCIQPNGGTPTLAAVQGSIDYAAAKQAQYPDSKTVIVFLTDGEPGFGFNYNGTLEHLYSCDDLPTKGSTWPNGSTCVDDDTTCTTPDSEVEKVAQVIKRAPAKSIYVAGVGDLSEQTLQAWGDASGNEPINLLNLTGTEAATTLRARLEAIRQSSISCEFDVPVPKDGSTINGKKTNVDYINGSNAVTNLYRTSDGTSGSCGAAANDWYFDNPNQPTKITLCTKTCAALQQDPKGSIQVVYGCDTHIAIL